VRWPVPPGCWWPGSDRLRLPLLRGRRRKNRLDDAAGGLLAPTAGSIVAGWPITGPAPVMPACWRARCGIAPAGQWMAGTACPIPSLSWRPLGSSGRRWAAAKPRPVARPWQPLAADGVRFAHASHAQPGAGAPRAVGCPGALRLAPMKRLRKECCCHRFLCSDCRPPARGMAGAVGGRLLDEWMQQI